MKNDPNLFEAFTDVARRGTPEESPASPGGGSPRQPGRPLLRGRGLELQPRLLLLVAVLMGASFVAGYALRGPGDQVRAAEPGKAAGMDLPPAAQEWRPSDDRGPAVPTSSGPSGVGGKSPQSELSAGSGLYNPVNLYTVLAITYDDLPHQETRARATAQFLRDQDLPAFDPIKHGDKIEVLVGATPTKSELQAILTKLQGLRGPNGKSFDFESALWVKIDSHVDRN